MTDTIFDLAASLGEDVAIDSGRGGKGAVERASRPVLPDSEGGRAGVFSVRPGAVSGFSLPEPPGPPRFGDGDLQVKQPVMTQYDAPPRWSR